MISNNNRCPKCGNKLNFDEQFCPKCGTKRESIRSIIKPRIKEFKVLLKKYKFIIIGVIIALIIATFFIVDNVKFNNALENAKYQYNLGKYEEAYQIIKSYSSHSSNEEFKKIDRAYHLYMNYTWYEDYMKKANSEYSGTSTKKDAYTNALKELLSGYEDCQDAINGKDEISVEVAKEIKPLYYAALISVFDLENDDIDELLQMERSKREEHLSEYVAATIKSNTCDKSNIDVVDYSKHSYELTVKLKNNNGCSWSIKSYSEVRVYFTDGSYEDVYLKTNINLAADETYTFSGCYLGSDNKYKSIKRVTFID